MTNKVMTPPEATDLALLLFVRKLQRHHPDAYADILARLPHPARHALAMGEVRADLLRDAGGAAWPADDFEDDEE